MCEKPRGRRTNPLFELIFESLAGAAGQPMFEGNFLQSVLCCELRSSKYDLGLRKNQRRLFQRNSVKARSGLLIHLMR